MTTRSTLTRADTMYSQSAYYPPANALPGLPISPTNYLNFGVVAAASANAICASQSSTVTALSLRQPQHRLGSCTSYARMSTEYSPTEIDLGPVAARYAVAVDVVEDLYARRRAGARDAELINLLRQPDRGGLAPERARALIAELPAR